MRGEIIEGDFPKGASPVLSGLLAQYVEISWSEGWAGKSESLKGKIDKIEFLDRGSLPIEFSGDSLTPLEGGIIGGSVAGYDGFLAGYLSLPDSREGVLFCVLPYRRKILCLHFRY